MKIDDPAHASFGSLETTFNFPTIFPLFFQLEFDVSAVISLPQSYGLLVKIFTLTFF